MIRKETGERIDSKVEGVTKSVEVGVDVDKKIEKVGVAHREPDRELEGLKLRQTEVEASNDDDKV
jgi:hypothetical protein